MSTEAIYICDRCKKEHRGQKPINWQTGVEIIMTADMLPNYSPLSVKEEFAHMCEECCHKIANAINAVLVRQ